MLTHLVIGEGLWRLKPRLWGNGITAFSQTSDTAPATTTSKFQTASCVFADTLNYDGGSSTAWIFNRQWVQVNTEIFQGSSHQVTCNLFVLIKQNQGKQQAEEAYTKLLLNSQKSKAIEQASFI